MDTDLFEKRECISRVLASRALSTSPRLQALFSYLADNALDEENPPPKEYSVGVDVFDRGDDFNPQTDSIVRVHAGRLRKALVAYYETEGRDDSCEISLPKGGYGLEFRPRFPRRTSSPATASSHADRAVAGPFQGNARYFLFALVLLGLTSWIVAVIAGGQQANDATRDDLGASRLQRLEEGLTVAISPFSSARAAEDDASARDIGIASDLTGLLATAMSRPGVVKLAASRNVMSQIDHLDVKRLGEALNVRFLVYGDVKSDQERYRVNIEVVDTVTQQPVWTQVFEMSGTDIMDVEARMTSRISSELRPQLYNAAMQIIGDTPPPDAAAWHYFLVSNWTPGGAVDSLAWEQERIALARKSLELDPEFGPPHAVLANKLAFLASVDPPSDTNDTRQAAVWHARQAVILSPDDADSMLALGLAFWHLGRMDESARMFQRTLALDPNQVLAGFLSWATPYACDPAPDDVLARMQAYNDNLTPSDPSRWLSLFFLAQMHVNRGEYAKALVADEAARDIFTNPLSVFRHAAILNEMGRTEEARAMLADERTRWPNLDPADYANASMPRRCGAENQAAARRPYDDLAEAMSVSR